MTDLKHELRETKLDDATGKWGWICSCDSQSGGFGWQWTAKAAHQMHADSHAMEEYL